MIKHWLNTFFSDDFTCTKRQLGVLLLIGGVLLLVAAGAAEVVRHQPGGFGTMQQIAVLIGVMSVIIGATLWPLGDRPA
ncbi:MAG: hypothetical protein JXA10_00920 [Anaerolineae bacterium]|nr:hypothetical protein [Anaerolineae bacterium]